MKELKLMIKYRKDGRLNSATISLNQAMINHLGNITLSFFYQNKEIILNGNNEIETYEKIKNGKIIELKRNIKLQSGRKLDLPLGILDDLGVNLEKENKIQIEFLKDHKLKLKLISLPIEK